VKLSINKNVRKIPYYPKAMMYGMDEGWIRLSSNENPFPPSQNVFSSILDALFNMNRYPGEELELKTAISERFGVRQECVIIGNGSNELIEMSLRAMKHDKRDKVIISEPSFAFYKIASMIYGYEVCSVPLVDMKVDLKAVEEQIDERTRLIFLNNPLNPTGTIFEEKVFKLFLKEIPSEILVVMDEAYGEFVESKKFPHSFELVNDFPVLVLKTFSKAYGLAGLRVGYGIGEESLLSFLERTKQPFSVNMIALIGAKTALRDEIYLKKVLDNNKRGKRFFYKALEELSIEYIPTESNFVLMKIGKQAETLSKKLFKEKILVRWMGAYSLPEYIRVTIGRMDENVQFIDALKRIL
jgi:histidinol-phosphate aminotransferase